MTFLSKLIKEFNVCKSSLHEGGGDWPILKDTADRIFRTIAEFPNPIDWS
jgi:hypothetical protein